MRFYILALPTFAKFSDGRTRGGFWSSHATSGFHSRAGVYSARIELPRDSTGVGTYGMGQGELSALLPPRNPTDTDEECRRTDRCRSRGECTTVSRRSRTRSIRALPTVVYKINGTECCPCCTLYVHMVVRTLGTVNSKHNVWHAQGDRTADRVSTHVIGALLFSRFHSGFSEAPKLSPGPIDASFRDYAVSMTKLIQRSCDVLQKRADGSERGWR